MLTLTAGKKAAMDRLSTKDGIISALAIDQRGALKKMIDLTTTLPATASPITRPVLFVFLLETFLSKYTIFKKNN